ncbi:MAG: glycosyltransferase family 4 protein [Phycisphaerales bacterium]
MRIGFLLPAVYCLSGPGNGVRVQALRQAEALRRAGHEVELMEAWTPFERGSIDVAHFFLGGGAFHMIEGVRSAGVRMLVFAPIIDTNESNRNYRLAARVGGVHRKIFTIPRLYRDQALGSDLVVCRSEHERARVVEGLGVDIERTEIVLNGVDPPPPADPGPARAAHGLPDEYALHVSRYDQPRKNVVRLIEAVGPTGRTLVIAGNAEETRNLALVREAAARFPNVKLLGIQPQELLESLYAGCRVFCLPSVHEGTGLVALEAAVHGAAIVITRNGGPPDYFLDLAEYVDPDRTDDLRAAFERAWQRPRTTALRDHVLRNLTWDRSAACLVEAYARHARSR